MRLEIVEKIRALAVEKNYFSDDINHQLYIGDQSLIKSIANLHKFRNNQTGEITICDLDVDVDDE
tara:strand:+ start:301 stop:495 length:195 start_codon:yes stop_codon:yes gene_type:complete